MNNLFMGQVSALRFDVRSNRVNSLVLCLKWMEIGCQVLLGHFGPVYLLQLSKNDDEESCF